MSTVRFQPKDAGMELQYSDKIKDMILSVDVTKVCTASVINHLFYNNGFRNAHSSYFNPRALRLVQYYTNSGSP